MADNYMDNIQMGKDEDAESFALHDLEAREKIDELDGLIAEAKELIDTLQTTQDRMQSTIASAQASIADNAAAITTINNDLSDLQESTQSCNSNVDNLLNRYTITNDSLSYWEENIFNVSGFAIHRTGGEVTSFLTNGELSVSALVMTNNYVNAYCDYLIMTAGARIYTGRRNVDGTLTYLYRYTSSTII